MKGKNVVAENRKRIPRMRERERERTNRGWTNSRGSHDTRERTRRTRRMSMAAPGKISQAAQVESGIWREGSSPGTAGARMREKQKERERGRERGERPNEAKARTRRKKRYIPVTRNLEIHPNTLACNARAFSQSPRFAMASALSPPFPIPSVTPSKTRGACSCLCWGCNNVLTYWST